jgi:hypothetical protein
MLCILVAVFTERENKSRLNREKAVCWYEHRCICIEDQKKEKSLRYDT